MLSCTTCKNPIPLAFVSMDGRTGRCPRCHTAVDTRPRSEQDAHSRPRTPQPRSMQVFDRTQTGSQAPYRAGTTSDAADLVIVRRWLDWESGISAVAVLFAVVFLAPTFAARLASGHAFARLYAAFLLASLLGAAYVTLAGLANRTTITVAHGRLSVRHGPVPWTGAGLAVADVAALTCRETSFRRQPRYELYAVRTSGAALKLLAGLKKPEEAAFLRDILEERLGLSPAAKEAELT